MWNGQQTFPRFFYVNLLLISKDIGADMNALLNAHTTGGCDSPPNIGFISNISPEAQSSETGVSSEYATREQADKFVRKGPNTASFVKYYLDKTLPPEANGKHPPLSVPYNAMINFIKATSTDSEHVRIVTPEQCHYKNGDRVRVIAGDFKGVIGKVARIAGQQRVVVEISRLCLVATAYIPSDFIEIIK